MHVLLESYFHSFSQDKELQLPSLPHGFSTLVCGHSSISVLSSPLWSPGPAVVGLEHGALDELAQAGNAAVPRVSPCPGPREPARDQEPHVAATEDHQELLGHGLEGQERCQGRAWHPCGQSTANIQHRSLPASRTVLL